MYTFQFSNFAKFCKVEVTYSLRYTGKVYTFSSHFGKMICSDENIRYVRILRKVENMSIAMEIVEITRESSRFVILVPALPMEISLSLSGCMHPEEEIESLLRGEDYSYGDCNLDIDQKNGTTTFSISNGDGDRSKFEISMPWTVCTGPLRRWVYAEQDLGEE